MLSDHWLDRIERRLGSFAIPGLASFLVGMNAAVWAMSLLRPQFPSVLVLDPQQLVTGEWWRAITFLFVPPAMAPLWVIFWLMLLYTFATALENEWGDFRFNLFYGAGAAATVAAAALSGWPLSNLTLNASLFLAFAALFPDFELLLFFVLPVKARWLALLTGASLAWAFLRHGSPARWEVASGLVNYLLFFGRHHLQALRARAPRRHGR